MREFKWKEREIHSQERGRNILILLDKDEKKRLQKGKIGNEQRK